MTLVRYRAPIDVAGRISNDDFHASVDLSKIVAQAGRHTGAGDGHAGRGEPAHRDHRLGAAARDRSRLDPVTTTQFPVTISRSGTPPGLTIGPTQTQPAIVTVRGASSLVQSIRRIEGRVTIDASAINVDTEVDLQALDDRGDVVSQLDIQPPRVHVKIEVAATARRTAPCR